MMRRPRQGAVRTEILLPALRSAAGKLRPTLMVHNPVMFTVEVGAALTTLLLLTQLAGVDVGGTAGDPGWFTAAIAGWLWLTAYFGNLAEAVAEGRGRAQADALRGMRKDTPARLRDGTTKRSSELLPGDVVEVAAEQLIPGDGTIIEGIASIDESAVTGESAPCEGRRRGPLRGDRRHAGALGSDRRRDNPAARRELPGPDDRIGRGCAAPQDPRTRSLSGSCSPG